ncbi:SAG-related sequence [Besnoitia besnoiti]|uniref:SAG-related sequence n=1 Tax=Besnoitia besnoiti TaxID=94643 RepID=A0A2A9MEV5_BESBE|nr:SAG-related sequence [Besnoitia besnoiti]PFH37048.1 SAG-related sequence [Besnoitia besnoiti]
MSRQTTMQRRGGSIWLKTRKLMAICLGGVLLLSSGNAFAQALDGEAEDGAAAEGPSDTDVKCDVSPDLRETGVTQNQVTLSSTHPVTTLLCIKPGSTMVPKGAKSVCEAKTDVTVENCEDKGCSSTLQALLESNREVRWTQIPITKSKQGEKWALNLEQTDFPFTDKSFFVGCKNEEHPSKTCRVDVTVKARSSSVMDNLVTCAYGAESNSEALKVELTEETSTLALACGKHGSINPTTYSTNYCENENLTSCTKSYSDILPNYSSAWWAGKSDTTDHVKLTIPKGSFPAEEQHFYVGCVPKAAKPEKPIARTTGPSTDTSTSAGASTCRVKVTVKAASSASPAVSSLAVVSAVSGLLVLVGYL